MKQMADMMKKCAGQMMPSCDWNCTPGNCPCYAACYKDGKYTYECCPCFAACSKGENAPVTDTKGQGEV
ncbi:MAG: hypothetical protein FWE67_16205 [Planctomycetaceae bacterium]|nr:hypothetical protein [Planctomycetaceae bacterium]